MPIDQALIKIRKIIIHMIGDPTELDKLSRIEREKLYQRIDNKIANEFRISELAKLILDGMFLAYLSFTYNTEIFQPYGLSIDLMKRFKKNKKL